jgi:hypothetical protein
MRRRLRSQRRTMRPLSKLLGPDIYGKTLRRCAGRPRAPVRSGRTLLKRRLCNLIGSRSRAGCIFQMRPAITRQLWTVFRPQLGQRPARSSRATSAVPWQSGRKQIPGTITSLMYV